MKIVELYESNSGHTTFPIQHHIYVYGRYAMHKRKKHKLLN